jgi:hypothetical protein
MLSERIDLFERIKKLPYATDAAHTAVGLAIAGRGDCLAKSEALVEGFRELGYPARRVRWLYELPDRPPEVELVGTRLDVHSAAEVRIGDRWVLVDATHDPSLARAGLTVAYWDGWSDTVPAYEPLGDRWIEGQEDAEAGRVISELLSLITPEAARAYRQAFNRWLDDHRSSRR